MGIFKEYNWNDVEVGKKYRYEEGYETQAEVIVLEKTITSDDNGDYVQYKIKVDKAFWGCETGDELYCGKNIADKYLYISNKMKFKPLDSWFDYMTPGFNPIPSEEDLEK